MFIVDIKEKGGGIAGIRYSNRWSRWNSDKQGRRSNDRRSGSSCGR
jgi:hypothetical protein